jgi:hypothetical protein
MYEDSNGVLERNLSFFCMKSVFLKLWVVFGLGVGRIRLLLV